MGYGITGENVYGELSSADAHSSATTVLYSNGGVARTLGAKERLVITDVQFVSAAGGDCRLTFTTGAATAGLIIFRGTFAANGGLAMSYLTPNFGPKGVVPFLTAPAGQVDVRFHGIILQS